MITILSSQVMSPISPIGDRALLKYMRGKSPSRPYTKEEGGFALSLLPLAYFCAAYPFARALFTWHTPLLRFFRG